MCHPYLKWKASAILQMDHKVHAESHNGYHIFKNLRHTQHKHAVDGKKGAESPHCFLRIHEFCIQTTKIKATLVNSGILSSFQKVLDALCIR